MLKPRSTPSINVLASEVIRKIDNANTKYAAGMIPIHLWDTAIARAIEGGIDFAFQLGQQSMETEDPQQVRRCV